MDMVKWWTPAPTFNREGFAKMLRNNCGVPACAVTDGVVLDREKFNSIPLALLPAWAYQWREAINNRFKTRKATPDEWPNILMPGYYSLVIVMKDNTAIPSDSGDALSILRWTAEKIADAWRGEEDFCSAVILGPEGEILYTAN